MPIWKNVSQWVSELVSEKVTSREAIASKKLMEFSIKGPDPASQHP